MILSSITTLKITKLVQKLAKATVSNDVVTDLKVVPLDTVQMVTPKEVVEPKKLKTISAMISLLTILLEKKTIY